MNFNKVVILGNLTRDPESKVLPSGQPVVNFSVATNRFWRDAQGNNQKEAEFHNIVVYGRLTEICSRYLRKGGLVLIEGRLKTRSWQDSGGQKHYRTEIIAEGIQLGPRNSGTSDQFPEAQAKPSSSVASPKEQTAKDKSVAEEEIPIINVDDELSNQNENRKPTNNKNDINIDEIPF
ncbi:MAG TPA: single-stranded DNA-binding protein [Candidatus Portnoybacteria bacterium]|nr:single-stranded DNA-binding protein [Candidatus Portnoybacteria bacterium]